MVLLKRARAGRWAAFSAWPALRDDEEMARQSRLLVDLALVAAALPVSYMSFGIPSAKPANQAAGGFFGSILLGFGASIVYLIVATIGYVAVHKKSLRTRWCVEAGILIAFLALLVYAGATAGS